MFFNECFKLRKSCLVKSPLKLKPKIALPIDALCRLSLPSYSAKRNQWHPSNIRLKSKAYLYTWWLVQNLPSGPTACLFKKERTRDDRAEKQKGAVSLEILLNHPYNNYAFQTIYSILFKPVNWVRVTFSHRCCIWYRRTHLHFADKKLWLNWVK